jgi:alpha-galactosidase
MISDDLRTMSKQSLAALSNKGVIAIDQDPAGQQGVNVSFAGNGEVWAKLLLNNNVAIALLNRGSSPVQLSTTAAALATAVGLPAASSYKVTNVWSGQQSTSTGSFSATVAAYSTVLLRVAPA